MNITPMVLSTDIARTRGLYKLLPIAPPLKVLEIVASGQTPILCGEDPAQGAEMVTAKIENIGYQTVEYSEIERCSLSDIGRANIAMRNNQLVILHGTIDIIEPNLNDADQNVEHRSVVEILNSLLAPGGIVAGCFHNRIGVQGLIRYPFGFNQRSKYTFLGASRLLNSSLLDRSRVFALYPGKNSPITLAEVNRSPSVVYSASQIVYLKNWFSSGNYYLKMFLSVFGIGLWFEDEYFFYAHQK